MTQTISTRSGNKRRERKLNVRRDTLDFRDRMFEATLIEVPTRLSLSEYRKLRIPVLDQGEEGACTGFGLATVANYTVDPAQGRTGQGARQRAHAVRDGAATTSGPAKTTAARARAAP